MNVRELPTAGFPGTWIRVEGVRLLGVRVTVDATLDAAEHARRVSGRLGSVTDPALLERLLDLPALVPVPDTAIWAELSGQPPAVARRAGDGRTVTRLLRPPLAIHQVVVSAPTGQELAAVHDASLFAGFVRRWIAVAVAVGCVPEAVALEAALCGEGIMNWNGKVVLAAEPLPTPRIDGWAWMLQEKAYRRWLRHRRVGL